MVQWLMLASLQEGPSFSPVPLSPKHVQQGLPALSQTFRMKQKLSPLCSLWIFSSISEVLFKVNFGLTRTEHGASPCFRTEGPDLKLRESGPKAEVT